MFLLAWSSGKLKLQNMTLLFRQIYFCLSLVLLLPLSAHAQAPEKCASTMVELKELLRDQAFSLKWEETTMDDGKPLVVSISEKGGVLSVEFVKQTKGLWADISGVICQTDKNLEIRFTAEQIRFGPAASQVLRYVLGSGGKFTLTRIGAKQLRVATNGWSGDFASMAN
jgi:hypothetical protein